MTEKKREAVLVQEVARLHALIRRHGGSGRPQLTFGGLVLDPLTRTVTLRGVPIDLSAREFAVLQALMRQPAPVFSREVLEAVVYVWAHEIGSNTI